jgi:plasmid stabilization system protein ParE
VRIVWSSDALSDFREALVWLDERNSRAGDQLELDIDSALSLLTRHPFMGRASDVGNVRLLSLVKWHRRIAYQIHSDFIYVVSIKHTRQNQTK